MNIYPIPNQKFYHTWITLTIIQKEKQERAKKNKKIQVLSNNSPLNKWHITKTKIWGKWGYYTIQQWHQAISNGQDLVRQLMKHA